MFRSQNCDAMFLFSSSVLTGHDTLLRGLQQEIHISTHVLAFLLRTQSEGLEPTAHVHQKVVQQLSLWSASHEHGLVMF